MLNAREYMQKYLEMYYIIIIFALSSSKMQCCENLKYLSCVYKLSYWWEEHWKTGVILNYGKRSVCLLTPNREEQNNKTEMDTRDNDQSEQTERANRVWLEKGSKDSAYLKKRQKKGENQETKAERWVI